MRQAERFLFHEDFSRHAGRSGPVRGADAEAALVAARSQAFEAGLESGRAQAAAEIQARLAGALEAVGDRAVRVLAGADALERQAQEDAIALALSFARAVAGAALKTQPLANLEQAVRETIRDLRRAPHLVVRVEASLVEEAEALITGIARERGFDGRLVVIGEPDMAQSDFALEWADGGVTRHTDALHQAVETVIARHFGQGPSATPPSAMPPASMPPASISQGPKA